MKSIHILSWLIILLGCMTLPVSNSHAGYLPPTAPVIQSTTANCNSTITIVWSRVDGVDGYRIYRSLSPYYGFYHVGTTTGEYSTTYIDQPPLNAWYYRVRAYKGHLESPDSQTYPLNGVWVIPGSPYDLEISYEYVTASSVLIYWANSIPSQSPYAGYRIYRSKCYESNYSPIGTTAGNVCNYVDSGLDAAESYFYKVRAFNGSAESCGETNTVLAKTCDEAFFRSIFSSSYPHLMMDTVSWNDSNYGVNALFFYTDEYNNGNVEVAAYPCLNDETFMTAWTGRNIIYYDWERNTSGQVFDSQFLEQPFTFYGTCPANDCYALWPSGGPTIHDFDLASIRMNNGQFKPHIVSLFRQSFYPLIPLVFKDYIYVQSYDDINGQWSTPQMIDSALFRSPVGSCLADGKYYDSVSISRAPLGNYVVAYTELEHDELMNEVVLRIALYHDGNKTTFNICSSTGITVFPSSIDLGHISGTNILLLSLSYFDDEIGNIFKTYSIRQSVFGGFSMEGEVYSHSNIPAGNRSIPRLATTNVSNSIAGILTYNMQNMSTAGKYVLFIYDPVNDIITADPQSPHDTYPSSSFHGLVPLSNGYSIMTGTNREQFRDAVELKLPRRHFCAHDLAINAIVTSAPDADDDNEGAKAFFMYKLEDDFIAGEYFTAFPCVTGR